MIIYIKPIRVDKCNLIGSCGNKQMLSSDRSTKPLSLLCELLMRNKGSLTHEQSLKKDLCNCVLGELDNWI